MEFCIEREIKKKCIHTKAVNNTSEATNETNPCKLPFDLLRITIRKYAKNEARSQYTRGY
jgi:hypothetical protein